MRLSELKTNASRLKMLGSYQEDDGSGTPALGGKSDRKVTFKEARGLCWKEAKETLPTALLSSFQNRYLGANVIYL